MGIYCIKPRFPVVSWHVLCAKAGYLDTKEESLLEMGWGLVSGSFLNESWDQLPWQVCILLCNKPIHKGKDIWIKILQFCGDCESKIHFTLLGTAGSARPWMLCEGNWSTRV